MPLTPSGLSPAFGKSIVTSTDNSFTWQTDGAQNGFYIEYTQNTSGANVSNTGWITSSIANHTFLANTFLNSLEYKWRVKIRNILGQESSYSEWAIFKGGSEPGVSITFPANDLDVLNSIPIYQHEYSNASGLYQVAYRYRLFTGTTWNDFDDLTAMEQESYTWDELEALSTGAILWDSGKVISTANSVEQPSEYLQVLQYWYKVQVVIWDNAENEITSDIRTFGLLVNSIPQKPSIIAVADGDNGRNVINITNPLPDIGQAITSFNRLYRRNIDGSWRLIQDNIIDNIGYDVACRASQAEEYAVSAVSEDDIESGKSDSAYAICHLSAYWFTNLATNQTVKIELEPQWGRMQSERQREEYWGMDEEYPTIVYGNKRFYRGSFQGLVMRPRKNLTWQKYTKQIRDVLDADEYSPIIMRSPFGDLYKINVYDFKIGQNDRLQQTRKISFNFIEVGEIVPMDTYDYDFSTTPLKGYWIIDPNTDMGYELYAEPDWGGLSSERDRVENVGLSGEYPSVNYGNKKAIRGGFSGLILQPKTGSLAEQVMKFRGLVDAPVKKPLIFKMISGDLFFIDAYGFSFELFTRTDQARRVSFEFIEIDGIVEETTFGTWGNIYEQGLTWGDIKLKLWGEVKDG